ncbi:MAG: hypothetical protein U1C70_03225 [Sediminibacterium sp.]|jgi:hypothetical protein|uniref:hypothetical protein n=1 Tax=Sediminibacterium sp. TaxID=1917865 RepID=UPI002ABB5790|nr:hypothetical protein [Sediminibacterium sp.]MDZ4070815.1 hypothetical protein [Sediminibacterium sp.]
MPDFFVTPCGRANCNHNPPTIVCKSVTNSNTFGLCDDPPPSTNPAYIQHYNQNDWIAEVNNPLAFEVTFKAIDNCVEVLRLNDELECRCDGFLHYNNTLIFVELKDRNSNGWLSKGRDQLTITIEKFSENHNIINYIFREAYVCNKQRPLAITGINTEIQKFKDDTANILNNSGLLLKADRNIHL